MTDNIQKTTWYKKWEREIKLWFSNEGKELQYCLVAQGYEEWLFEKMWHLFATPITAFDIIKEIKKEVF